MAKLANIRRVKDAASNQLEAARERYEDARLKHTHYFLLRWIASMSAVEAYPIWERYAEKRLTIALINHPQHFLTDNNIHGMKAIPVGLATTLVRGGGRYFDFRSTGDLLDKADRIVSKSENPFRNLPANLRRYLDTLGAIRNYIVHQSDSAFISYKSYLSSVYGVKAKPSPPEFLNSVDYRASSPARNQPRLIGIMEVVRKSIALS